MALQPGATLGPYHIVSLIGAGGMGEVYRARDPRLDREVAIKVLPHDRVADESRRQRFIQEAKAASALNHPNIVTIHEIESADGRDFIVMELVRGKSLDALIPRQGMRLNEVLRIGIAVADAMAAAHARGIVHRDLKPANVMVATDGAVKVLDFGLAKLRDTESTPEGETHTQLADPGLSTPGTIAGTAAYMSPEQASGEPVDARSDIFSFGAMLYEMLTGQRAFAGNSTADTLGAVMRAQPKPPSTIVSGLPVDLEKLILRCLRKDPARRFQNMADVRVALLDVKEESESGTALPVEKANRRAWPLVAAVTAVVAVLLGIVALRLRHATGSEGSAPIAIRPLTAEGGGHWGPRLSPDGETVAYAWTGAADDNWDIYVKAVGPGTRPVRLTDDPATDLAPAWSPDGHQIAFARLGSDGGYAIYLIPSMGGTERKLIDVPGVTWGGGGLLTRLAWSPDGQWLVYCQKPSAAEPSRIFKLSMTTLVNTPMTNPQKGTVGDIEPAISPDGGTLAFVRSGTFTWGQEDVWLQAVAGGEPRRLTLGRYNLLTSLSWTTDGSEVVFSDGYPGLANRLFRVRLSGDAPEPLAGVGHGAAHGSVVKDKAVFVQTDAPAPSIWRIENPRLSSGAPTPVRVITSGVNAAISPDGKRVAFQSGALGVSNIWVAASDGGHPTQLTDFKQEAGTPRWSPDGRWLVFDSTEKGSYDLWVVPSAAGFPRRLTQDPLDENTATWSANGQMIYFSMDRTGRRQIWKVPVAGGTPVQVTRNGGSYGVESADGKSLYYTGDYGGPLHRMALDGADDVEVVHEVVGWWDWALGKKGIYYRVGRPGLVLGRGAMEILYQPFDSSGPVSLYRLTNDDGYCLAVSPDERWLMFGEVPPWTSELMLIENFR